MTCISLLGNSQGVVMAFGPNQIAVSKQKRRQLAPLQQQLEEYNRTSHKHYSD